MTPQKEFVLDGSVTMAWYFADESNAYADAVLSDLESARALVPTLWSLEVANTVLVGERRKRSTEAQAAAWLGILETLSIEVDDETNSHAWSGPWPWPARRTFRLTMRRISNLRCGEACPWRPSTPS